MAYTTEQESFWKGQFGNEYTNRNRGEHLIAANLSLFGKVLGRMQGIQTVLELGANIGLNLKALTRLLPKSKLSALEINEKAAQELKETLPQVDLYISSILQFQPKGQWDLVFTKGLLIHIDPDKLSKVYELMHYCSSRYILMVEYYNPKPTEVVYRGHEGKLFKRDFAGEMLDSFSDLSLVDYGFVYHRDPNFPQDDETWFLMEKK